MGTDRPVSRGDDHSGEHSPYGRSASALSALGRASEHALTESERDRGAPASGQAATGAPASHARARRGPRFSGRAVAVPLPSLRRRRGFGGRRRFGRRPQHGPRRARSLRRVAGRALLVCGLLIVLAGVYTVVQLLRPVPRPTLHTTSSLSATQTVPGGRPSLPWPSEGEAAAALAGYGTLGSSGPSAPMPIASLAKVMAGLVVLRDHPLTPGASGPSLTMTAADQSEYQAELAAGDSVAPVAAGERLTEMQLLQAMLIPSADNIASVLGRWDAGSDAAFVAKMNAAAASLGMRSTHYADANGLSASTTSTAGDQLRLAEAAAANPVLMSIVRLPSITLPDGTVLTNYDTLLGQSGVVGIKTGSTLAAGGCFMLAADATVAGHHVTVLAVVLGQQGSPFTTAALQASRVLVAPALAALHPLTLLPAGTTVARITTPWGQPVPVRTTRAVSVLGIAGTPVHVQVTVNAGPLRGSPPAGSQVATVTVSAAGEVTTVPAVTAGPIPPASVRWRLERL